MENFNLDKDKIKKNLDVVLEELEKIKENPFAFKGFEKYQKYQLDSIKHYIEKFDFSIFFQNAMKTILNNNFEVKRVIVHYGFDNLAKELDTKYIVSVITDNGHFKIEIEFHVKGRLRLQHSIISDFESKIDSLSVMKEIEEEKVELLEKIMRNLNNNIIKRTQTKNETLKLLKEISSKSSIGLYAYSHKKISKKTFMIGLKKYKTFFNKNIKKHKNAIEGYKNKIEAYKERAKKDFSLEKEIIDFMKEKFEKEFNEVEIFEVENVLIKNKGDD